MATILDALGTMRATYLRKKAEHPSTLTPGERAELMAANAAALRSLSRADERGRDPLFALDGIKTALAAGQRWRRTVDRGYAIEDEDVVLDRIAEGSGPTTWIGTNGLLVDARDLVRDWRYVRAGAERKAE